MYLNILVLMSVGWNASLHMISKGLSFYSQEPRVHPIVWDNPSSNICPESSLLLYLMLIRASQHFSFNERWPCAPPNTHFQEVCFVQGPIFKRLDWHRSQSNFYAHKAWRLPVFHGLRTVRFIIT